MIQASSGRLRCAADRIAGILETAGEKCCILVRISGCFLEGDMVDLDAGMMVGKRELGIDGDTTRLDFEVDRDLGRAAPIELVIAAEPEIDDAGRK